MSYRYFIIACLLTGCSHLPSNKLSEAIPAYGPRNFNGEGWTAIVAAYDPEIAAITEAFSTLDKVTISNTVTYKGVTYQIGQYGDEPVVIFTTGISVPNAAMTTQMALDYFPIDRLIMMGIAGAINPQLRPGDITVPERWYFHDESVYVNPDGQGGYVLPDYYSEALQTYQVRTQTDPHAPRYENFQFIHPEEMAVIKQGWDEPRQMPYFNADDELLRLTRLAANQLGTVTLTNGRQVQTRVGGNGVTGSVFLDNADYRQWVQRVFNAEVTEMESAAVAQVCFVNEVDWIIIRSVSDLAGGQDGKNEENLYDDAASETGTRLLISLMDQLTRSPVDFNDVASAPD